MTRREKVMVLAMAGAIVYGGYSLLWAPETKAPKKSSDTGRTEGTSGLVADVVGQLKKLDPSGNAAQIIAMANESWPEDLFRREPMRAARRAEAQPAADVAHPRFTGFLQMGDVRLAIIDGVEYEAGEMLPSGYRVKSISPARVVLQTGTGQEELNLQLETID